MAYLKGAKKFRRLFILSGVLLVVLTLGVNSAQACNCLTRTPGFWGTHPEITLEFLDDIRGFLEVCGVQLTTVGTGCTSAIEALCVAPGVESPGNPQLAQLARQLAAAKLNLRATWSQNGGCGEEVRLLVQECEDLCADDPSAAEITESECISRLDAFNNTIDTFPEPFPPFDSPGPARPATCRQANGNGILIPNCN